jgi:hypothetical protein
MVSEYALGSYGWVLALMFLAWSASGFALFFALRPWVRTAGGKIGLGFLLISAAGAGMGAMFDFTHPLHGLAFLFGIPTLPAAALLIRVSLLRSPAWSPMRRPLSLAANLPWLSLAVFIMSMAIGFAQGGGFGSGLPIGWPNRILIAAYCGWSMAAARLAMRADRR